MGKDRKELNFGAIAVIFVLLFSCGKKENVKATHVFEGKLDVVPANAVVVSKRLIRAEYSFLGSTVPENEVSVSPEIAGKVKRVYVREGERVRKGQLLFELDTSELELTLENIRALEKRIKVQLENAKRELERAKKLFEAGAISKAEFEKIQTTFLTLKAEEENVKSRKKNIKLRIAKAKVRSPIDGVVLDVLVDTGEFITPPAPAVIVATEKTYFEGILPEAIAQSLKAGTKVKVKFPTIQKSVQGEVLSVFKAPDGTFRAKVELSEKIPPAVAGRAYVKVTEGEGYLVPAESLWIDTDGNWIFAVSVSNSSYIARKLKVKVRKVLSSGVWIEPPRDITAVVSPATDRLSDGIKLNVIGWQKNATE